MINYDLSSENFNVVNDIYMIARTVFKGKSIIDGNFNLVKQKKIPRDIVLDFSNEGDENYTKFNIMKCINKFKDFYGCQVIALSQNPQSCDGKNIFYYNFAWSYFNKPQKIKHKSLKYKFNYLGGFPRKDKILFLNELIKNNFFKESIKSFGSLPSHLNSYANKELMDQAPYIIDTDMLYSKHNSDFWQQIKHHPYQNSRFTLVQETEMQTHTSRYTEKTLKAITVGSPFIIAGNYKCIERIRKDGFLTFHPYINESYDQEKEMPKKINMILREVDRLCSMKDCEWNEFYKTILKPIIKYNQEAIKGLPDKKKFISSLKF
jgi:hypothetical protein